MSAVSRFDQISKHCFNSYGNAASANLPTTSIISSTRFVLIRQTSLEEPPRSLLWVESMKQRKLWLSGSVTLYSMRGRILARISVSMMRFFPRVFKPVDPRAYTTTIEAWNASDHWPRPKDLHCGLLDDLSTLPYWSRAWIQQEIVLARQVRILYGRFELLDHTVSALIRFCSGEPVPSGDGRFHSSRLRSLWWSRKSRQHSSVTFWD